MIDIGKSKIIRVTISKSFVNKTFIQFVHETLGQDRQTNGPLEKQ